MMLCQGYLLPQILHRVWYCSPRHPPQENSAMEWLTYHFIAFIHSFQSQKIMITNTNCCFFKCKNTSKCRIILCFCKTNLSKQSPAVKIYLSICKKDWLLNFFFAHLKTFPDVCNTLQMSRSAKYCRRQDHWKCVQNTQVVSKGTQYFCYIIFKI